MSPQARHRLAIALIFITPGFWSANYIVARSAIGVVEPQPTRSANTTGKADLFIIEGVSIFAALTGA